MNKKVDTTELDIPIDDIDCWERYPKHRWVYDLSRLLDSQHIKWSPYETEEFAFAEPNLVLEAQRLKSRRPGFIYIKKNESPVMYTEVYITKGEIKLMRHIDPQTHTELDTIIGEIELRLNAFVAMHFSKFTGVITCRTHGNDIYRVQLRPYSELGQNTSIDIVKLTKRIYKRSDTNVNGPSDRSLRETLAS